MARPLFREGFLSDMNGSIGKSDSQNGLCQKFLSMTAYPLSFRNSLT